MKHYHYLIFLTLMASFSSCKKESTDPLIATTTEGRQISKNLVIEEEKVIGPTFETPETQYSDIFAYFITDFDALERNGLPYRYYCNFTYSTTRPQPFGQVYEHKISHPDGLTPYVYKPYTQKVIARYIETTGRLESTNQDWWDVKVNTTYYGEHRFTVKLTLKRVD